MNAGGKKEVLYEGVNVGEKDYSAIVSKIKASGADYVMWGGLHTEGGLIVRQMRDQGMKTVMISGDGITDDEFAQIGGPGVEGTLMSFGPEPRNNPNAKDDRRRVQGQGLRSRRATRSIPTRRCRSSSRRRRRRSRSTPKKIAAYMHSGKPFHTVIGDIAYDKKGDRTTVDYVWYVWEKGADGKITFKQIGDGGALRFHPGSTTSNLEFAMDADAKDDDGALDRRRRPPADRRGQRGRPARPCSRNIR